jgi:glutaredoxin
MNRAQRVDELARLFEATELAHRRVFAAEGGADSDWPIWYANYLQEHAGELLPDSLGRAAMVKLLLELESEHAARSSDTPWARFYAETLVDRFVAEDGENLQLYVSHGCGFCSRVLHVIDTLGVQVHVRDIYADPTARRELIAARGRATVPVLRCTAGEVDRFMPESADIIRYLRSRFG